jgi:ribonuclease P protein component
LVSSLRFPADARVRKRGAFVEIQREGRKLSGTAVLMFVHPQRKPHRARLGITVSRRVGCAVVRNTVKRRLREVFRLHPGWFAVGSDYVLVAKPAAAQASYGDLETEIERLSSRGPRISR